MVQTGHSGEARAGHVRGVVSSNQGVGVGRVTHNQDLDVVSGYSVNGCTLRTEDTAVGLQQVRALHARTTRHRTNQEGNVGAVESLLGVIENVHATQGREGGVEQLHSGTLSSLNSLGDLQQA